MKACLVMIRASVCAEVAAQQAVARPGLEQPWRIKVTDGRGVSVEPLPRAHNPVASTIANSACLVFTASA
jgi:hypothetical protein